MSRSSFDFRGPWPRGECFFDRRYRLVLLGLLMMGLSGCLPPNSETTLKAGAPATRSDTSRSDTSQGDAAQLVANEQPSVRRDVGATTGAGVVTTNSHDSEPARSSVDQASGSIGQGPDPQTEIDRTLRILAWNIESDGANPDVIADQLRQLPKYDIYGFSEVRPSGFPAIKRALGDGYQYMYTMSGNDDRLAYAIARDRFEVLDHYEFTAFREQVINPGNYRSPFVFELRDKVTERQFLIVINHLARGKAEVRQQQALGIRNWAAAQNKPILAIGDYNFDYVFATDKGNPAMDVFLDEDIFHWVRPDPMVDSNYYDEDQDGVDDYPGSLLDFVFVAGDARQWDCVCHVIVRDDDFPDDLQTSDHRPVELLVAPPNNR